MDIVKNDTRRRVITHPSPYFVNCNALPVDSDILDNRNMSNISGEGFWGAVAMGVARGVAGGAVGVAAGIGTAIIWHYYGDDIIAEIDEVSRGFIEMGDALFDH